MDVTQAWKSINTMIYLLPFIQNHFLGVFIFLRSNKNSSERTYKWEVKNATRITCIVILCRKHQKKFWKEFFSRLLLCAQKWLSLDSFPETKLWVDTYFSNEDEDKCLILYVHCLLSSRCSSKYLTLDFLFFNAAILHRNVWRYLRVVYEKNKLRSRNDIRYIESIIFYYFL